MEWSDFYVQGWTTFEKGLVLWLDNLLCRIHALKLFFFFEWLCCAIFWTAFSFYVTYQTYQVDNKKRIKKNNKSINLINRYNPTNDQVHVTYYFAGIPGIDTIDVKS